LPDVPVAPAPLDPYAPLVPAPIELDPDELADTGAIVICTRLLTFAARSTLDPLGVS